MNTNRTLQNIAAVAVAVTLSTGVQVQVDPAQPLPEAVKADILSPAQVAVTAQKLKPFLPVNGIPAIAPWDAARTAAFLSVRNILTETGRRSVVVFKVAGGSDGNYYYDWELTSGRAKVQKDKGLAVAAAQADVAAQPDPTLWDLIVLE